MKSDNKDELFPVMDEVGNVVGSATRGECHGGSRLLHPVVHLHLFDADGRIYLQKRPEWKDIQPGKWDTAVGGHVDYGESIAEALRREVREEVGLTQFDEEFLTRYIFDSGREREYVHTYRARIHPDAGEPSDELDGGRWWTIAELEASPELLTPNLRQELRQVFGINV
ncbi:MAG: NUDIX domain-containing protein [Muribaculaceae bacterium]|nr:NUDIX domain-containing protein [Muribaculaceae bacterium]